MVELEAARETVAVTEMAEEVAAAVVAAVAAAEEEEVETPLEMVDAVLLRWAEIRTGPEERTVAGLRLLSPSSPATTARQSGAIQSYGERVQGQPRRGEAPLRGGESTPMGWVLADRHHGPRSSGKLQIS